MAIQKVTFQSKRGIPTYACQEVVLCLTDAWLARTTTGYGWVFGNLENNGRYLGIGRPPYPFSAENVRGDEVYQYTIDVDDTQFNGEFTLTCDDIVDISPDACLFHHLETALP